MGTCYRGYYYVTHYDLRNFLLLYLKLAFNCGLCTNLYPSSHEDWVHPNNITNVICVGHVEIGEATRDHQTHPQLSEDSIFYAIHGIN